MGRIRRASWCVFALPAAVGTAVALAGCGGGDGSSADGSAELPEPSQPISEQIPVFERATSRLDCEDALRVVHPTMLPDYEHPESKRNCDQALYRLRSIGEFNATDSQEQGTAAVVDGQIDGNDISLVWAIDEQGTLKWTTGINPRPQVGTEAPSGFDFRESAVAFLDALRDDDCKAAYETLSPDARLSYPKVRAFCRSFEDTFTAGKSSFGSRLEQDPDAELVELGATQDLAFYGVATEPAGYRTLVVTSSGTLEAPKLFDVVPAER